MLKFIAKQCFNLLLVIVVLSFLGVVPLSTYKDIILDKVSSANQSTRQDNDATATTMVSTTTAIPLLPVLKNPTWSQLLVFLEADKTDEIPYNYPTFVCDNFASVLQSNAKKAGWRCAKVTLDMTGYNDPYRLGIASDAGHACNAFETVDRGLVYIDCTGILDGYPHPSSCDKIVDVSVGGRYIPIAIFPEYGWSDSWEDMGRVTKISVKW